MIGVGKQVKSVLFIRKNTLILFFSEHTEQNILKMIWKYDTMRMYIICKYKGA